METDGNNALAISQLPAEMAILKLENDTIQSLAASRPRNHASIKADLVAQLEAYPAFAQGAIYAKPVGTDPETGKQKIARGLSVRAAEAIAESYGYCRVRSDVTIINDDLVKVEATFTDYQKGRIWQDAGVLSKWYKAKGGKMARHPDDRFFSVVVKAEVSRRIREVILRSVPPGLRAELQNMAERQMAKTLTNDAIKNIVTAFQRFGVSLEMLERFIGKSIGAGWTDEDRLDLLGVFNALKDGETTVAETFGKPDQPATANAAATGGDGNGQVTADALTGGKATTPAAKQPAQSQDQPKPETVVEPETNPDHQPVVEPETSTAAQDATTDAEPVDWSTVDATQIGTWPPALQALYADICAKLMDARSITAVNDAVFGFRQQIADCPAWFEIKVAKNADERRAEIKAKRGGGKANAQAQQTGLPLGEGNAP